MNAPTVRRTSVYTLRVPLGKNAGTRDVNSATARLHNAALASIGSALISDSHGSVSGWDFPGIGGPAPYASVSLRIPTDDADALALAGRLAAAAGHPMGWVLTTGLGAHRRIVTTPDGGARRETDGERWRRENGLPPRPEDETGIDWLPLRTPDCQYLGCNLSEVHTTPHRVVETGTGRVLRYVPLEAP